MDLFTIIYQLNVDIFTFTFTLIGDLFMFVYNITATLLEFFFTVFFHVVTLGWFILPKDAKKGISLLIFLLYLALVIGGGVSMITSGEVAGGSTLLPVGITIGSIIFGLT